jgi:predicted metal-dependent peptidase
MNMNAETKLKRAHIALMRHPETCLYAGVLLMGTSDVVDTGCPTAYTDGRNKRYGRQFIDKLTVEETAGVALHETLHVMLKHLPRHRDLWKDNAKMVNMAADYVVNDIIMNLKDKTFCTLPAGRLYDAKYHGWSVREVYEDLKKNPPEGGGGGQGSMDEHGFDEMQEATAEELKEMSAQIDEAIQQGAMLAGKMGASIPRQIQEMMQPKVDWRDALRDFVTSHARGAEEYTWRRYNRRRVADDIYLPSAYAEAVGEVVVAIDTSGSIGGKDIAEFAAELSELCQTCTPSRVRVLWWDTQVHGEQVFEEDYNNLRTLLKPQGGGGTHVSCVPKYIEDNGIEAECVIVFTDGYVESGPRPITQPSLWLVTKNKNFTPPAGKTVRFE